MDNHNREVVYRKIPSLLFMYEISEDGRHVRNVKSKHELRQQLTDKGYYRVHVSIKGKDRKVFVHNLVAECWLGPKPDGLETDHIDRNKSNNHYSNLRYVTHSTNCINKTWTDARANSAKKAREVQYKPVYVNDVKFKNKADAARYIAEQTGKNWRTIVNRLGKQRRYVHGYTISYCRDCTL